MRVLIGTPERKEGGAEGNLPQFSPEYRAHLEVKRSLIPASIRESRCWRCSNLCRSVVGDTLPQQLSTRRASGYGQQGFSVRPRLLPVRRARPGDRLRGQLFV